LATQWLRRQQSRQQGNKAEQRACDWLTRQGLVLIERNWHCRLGEIDLIMQHGTTLVFIEVRLRSQNAYGGALASVDQHKQRRLVAAANHFLAHHPRWANSNCRFDVVAMEHPSQTPNWIENAFYGE
jgi:putative endonuclease